MDANTVLAWMVGFSCASMVAFVVIRHGAKAWGAVNAAIFAVLAVGMWRFPGSAGFVASALWAPLVGVPMVGAQLVRRRVEAQRYESAARVARLIAWTHPFGGWQSQASWLEALELEQRGELDQAVAKLRAVATRPETLRTAKALELRWLGQYAELRAWAEEPEQLRAMRRDPALLVGYFRALGELGDLEALARVYAAELEAGSVEGAAQANLLLSAFGGRTRTTEALLSRRFAHMPETTKRLWRLTARQAAGEDVTPELRALAEQGAPGVRRIARARLARGVGAAQPSAAVSVVLDRLGRDVASIPAVSSRRTPATIALTVINLYVFAREIPGGTTDTANLYRMGALVASNEFRARDAWRLATAACLHLGALHVALNVLALILLGRQLEARVGSWRTVFVYVASALGGNLAYVAYVALSGHEATVVVGASGAIMGLVGALALAAWRRFRRDGTRLAKRQVIAIVSVPALQAMFDAFTPQVSMAVHLFGLGMGAVAALLVGQPADSADAPRRRGIPRTVAFVALGIAASVGALEWVWAAESPHPVCAEGRDDECRRKCEQGTAQACDWLAYREWHVDAPREQLADAASLWARGCDLGSAVGCNDLGLMVASGIGVPRDSARAVALFKRSCDGGDEHGCAELGRALLEGRGIVPDIAAGRRFLQSACDRGDDTACREVRRLDARSGDDP